MPHEPARSPGECGHAGARPHVWLEDEVVATALQTLVRLLSRAAGCSDVVQDKRRGGM